MAPKIPKNFLQHFGTFVLELSSFFLKSWSAEVFDFGSIWDAKTFKPNNDNFNFKFSSRSQAKSLAVVQVQTVLAQGLKSQDYVIACM